MKFQHLELLFTVTSHIDLSGELMVVGKLQAMGFSPFAVLELLEKDWRRQDHTPFCKVTKIEVRTEALEPLVDRIRSLWSEGVAPRIKCHPNGATAWHELSLVVGLDGADCLLRIAPTDGIEGPDTASIKLMLHELAKIAGLPDASLGLRREPLT